MAKSINHPCQCFFTIEHPAIRVPHVWKPAYCGEYQGETIYEYVNMKEATGNIKGSECQVNKLNVGKNVGNVKGIYKLEVKRTITYGGFLK